MTEQAPLRKERADATRSRSRILHAAEEHFRAFGVSASLEAVAKDAGVGPATLYRHFPNREALLADLLKIHRDELLGRQQDFDDLADAGEALRQWLRSLEEYFGLFEGLSEPLEAAARSQDRDHPLARSCEELITTTGKYLRAAQAEGRARQELEGLDLFLAANAVSRIAGTRTTDEASIARLRTLLEVGYLAR